MAKPDFITIGSVLASWGKRGQLKIKALTDFPERFNSGSTVYINHIPMIIGESSPHRDFLILKLESVDSIEAAEKLRGLEVEIPASQIKTLPEGQYYYFELVGLSVFTTKDENIGKITSVLTTGSNDVYVVKGKKGEVLIPAIEDVVKSVDIEQGRMVIEPIEGLL